MIYTESFQARRQAGIRTIHINGECWECSAPPVTLLDIKTMTELVRLPSSLLPSTPTNLVLDWDGAGEEPVVLGGEICGQPALLAGHHRHCGHPDPLWWSHHNRSWQIVFHSFILLRQFSTIKYLMLDAWKLFDNFPLCWPVRIALGESCSFCVVSVQTEASLCRGRHPKLGRSTQPGLSDIWEWFNISVIAMMIPPTASLRLPPLRYKLFDLVKN